MGIYASTLLVFISFRGQKLLMTFLMSWCMCCWIHCMVNWFFLSILGEVAKLCKLLRDTTLPLTWNECQLLFVFRRNSLLLWRYVGCFFCLIISLHFELIKISYFIIIDLYVVWKLMNKKVKHAIWMIHRRYQLFSLHDEMKYFLCIYVSSYFCYYLVLYLIFTHKYIYIDPLCNISC